MEFFSNFFLTTLGIFFLIIMFFFIGVIIRIVVDENKKKKIEKKQHDYRIPDKTIEFAILGGTGKISFNFYVTNNYDIRCYLSVAVNTIDSKVKRDFEKRLEKNNFKFEHYNATKMIKDLDINEVKNEIDAIIDDWSEF